TAGAGGAGGLKRLDATRGTPKISPRVIAATRRLIVKFEDGVARGTEAKLLRSADTSLDDRVPQLDVSVVEVAPRDAREAEASLEASPQVEYVERDAVVRSFAAIPNDTLWRSQWGLQLLDLPLVWAASSRAMVVPVAVIDTGVDAGHPDLAGMVGPGRDFVNDDDDATDDNGHGTAAAGVIAAHGGNALGGAGICQSCTVIPVKVLDAAGAGTTAMVAEAIVWATDHGARVINLSLGSPTRTEAVRDAIGYAVGRGVIVVAAAGNEGTSEELYPAAEAGVVSVGATMRDDALYDWSNRGAWVRLAAPGCNTAPGLGGGFVEFCGTSSAAPVVAGLAAVALAQEPQAARVRIEEALGAGAIPVPDIARGRINAREALAMLGARLQPEPVPVPLAVRLLRGSISAQAPARRFKQQIGEGVLRVVVRSTQRLTVTVVNTRSRVVGRSAGRRVLEVAPTLPAGAYSVVVRGPAAARFSLALTYPRTPKEAAAWLARTRT
ncbi:MAG: serine protease, partial [Gaiellaceae bacterium]|nr:serine protease [Gaiellaceae bacterium]